MLASTRNRRSLKNASKCSSRCGWLSELFGLTYGNRLEPVSVQGESVGVSRLGQPNGSDSTNNSESNTVAGLDVLLQLLQNTNASSVADMPQSDDLELSRQHSNENAVQAAATALNQLSQQESPDPQNPIATMLQSVCPFLRRPIYNYEEFVASTVPRIRDADATLRATTIFP